MGGNKRVTIPFNEKVRVRIFGSSTSIGSNSSSNSNSGSEHEGEYNILSPSPSPCLSYLVQNFLENESTNITNDSNTVNEPDSDSDSVHGSDPAELINTVINPTVFNNSDHFGNQLLADVAKAEEIYPSQDTQNKTVLHKNLLSYLIELGYNAGLCKTKWTSSKTLNAGNYEFLDVISNDQSNNQTRYIIDVDFSSEFEIARETESYRILRGTLPRTLVIKPEELKKILRLMCDEAKKSMKMNGLILPPWRKNRYMQMKWLGPYRRSTGQLVGLKPVLKPVVSGFPVKCRAVGFDVGGDSDRFLFTPVARTR